MRITRTVSAIILAALLASCDSRSPDDDSGNTNSQNQTGGSTLGGGTTGTTTTTDDESFVGLWDFSDFLVTEYHLWTESSFTVYDYQAQAGGTGENCYILTEIPYTRDGNQVTYNGFVYYVTRDDDILTVGGEPGNLIEYLTEDDLNECL